MGRVEQLVERIICNFEQFSIHGSFTFYESNLISFNVNPVQKTSLVCFFYQTSVQMCLKILIGDPIALGGGDESSNSVAHSAPTTVLSSFSPPQNFCSAVVKLTCLLMQALGVSYQ